MFFLNVLSFFTCNSKIMSGKLKQSGIPRFPESWKKFSRISKISRILEKNGICSLSFTMGKHSLYLKTILPLMDFSHFLAQRVFWGALSHEIIISFTTQLQIKFFCSFVQNFQDPGNPGKKSSFIQIFFQDFQNPGNFRPFEFWLNDENWFGLQ